MAFNFSEEEINEMYKMYQDVLGEIQEETKSVAESITERARELKYEPVIKLSVDAVQYYNEELKAAELKAMSEWQSGDLSFSKVMEKMSAGDRAKDRSKQLEGQIEQEIQSWRSIDDSGLSGIDTTNWKCDASDFDTLKQIIDSYVESLDTKLNSYSSSIEEKKEENEIYVSIEPVVIQAISIVMAGFKSGINESFSALAREFDVRASEVRSMGAGTAQSVKAKSESFVSSGASALKAKVKQILD